MIAQEVTLYRVTSMLCLESMFNFLILAVLQKPLGVVTEVRLGELGILIRLYSSKAIHCEVLWMLQRSFCPQSMQWRKDSKNTQSFWRKHNQETESSLIELVLIISLMGSSCLFFLNTSLCFHAVLIYEEHLLKLRFLAMETRQPQNTADLLFL